MNHNWTDRKYENELGMIKHSLNVGEEEFSVNNDFYLCPMGIGFVFDPYEIGPYVMGFVEVFVPFKEIAPAIRTDGPLQAFAKY